MCTCIPRMSVIFCRQCFYSFCLKTSWWLFFYFLFDVFSFFSPKNIVDLFLLFSIFFLIPFFRFLLSTVAENEMVNDRSWTDPLEISVLTPPLSFRLILIVEMIRGAARESKSSKQNGENKAQRSWSKAHSQLSIVFLFTRTDGGTHQRRLFQWKIIRRRDWAVVSNSSRHRQPIVTVNNIMDLFVIYIIIISLRKRALGDFSIKGDNDKDGNNVRFSIYIM